MKCFVASLATLSTCLAFAQAELVFEKEHLELTPKPDAESVTATFDFKYTGERPINVQEVDANCGCISAESDKKRYVKGDAGSITFVFELGSREGKQSNRVWITYTEDVVAAKEATPKENLGPSGEDPSTFVSPKTKTLTVDIDIPVIVNIEPKMTTWAVGSKPEPREVQVTMKHLGPIHITEVKSSREDVKVALKEVKKGESYIITLTPGSTDKKRLGMLTIVTDSKNKRHQKKLGFFSITNDEAKGAKGQPIVPPPAEALRR